MKSNGALLSVFLIATLLAGAAIRADSKQKKLKKCPWPIHTLQNGTRVNCAPIDCKRVHANYRECSWENFPNCCKAKIPLEPGETNPTLGDFSSCNRICRDYDRVMQVIKKFRKVEVKEEKDLDLFERLGQCHYQLMKAEKLKKKENRDSDDYVDYDDDDDGQDDSDTDTE